MYQGEKPRLHVGIIMDGNGRWAKVRGLSRIAGHARGARRVSEIVRACPGLGVTHLTLYAFSTENWQRPLAEVEGLMRIFRQYIHNKMEDLHSHDVRVRFIGMRHRLPERLQALMVALEDRTRHCRGLELTIAIDYGSRDELTRAVRQICAKVTDGVLEPDQIGMAEISAHLDTAVLPDPDFIIRTSGEQRLSNFLLWQAAYAEYVFPEIAWPDFGASEFASALQQFRGRDRRFGAIDGAVDAGGRPLRVGAAAGS